jgi:hypothetical protein
MSGAAEIVELFLQERKAREQGIDGRRTPNLDNCHRQMPEMDGQVGYVAP